MAPQAKRRRSYSNEHGNPKDDASFDISQLKPHETVWFDDGNIVLATDVHLYRVHKGVLAKNSSVFKNMLDIPTGEGGEDANVMSGDQWNGLPVVQMVDDSDEGVYHLLMTLYDRDYYRGTESKSFPIILSLLRLSTKYDIPAIRREVVQQLKRYYPSDLEHWDNFKDLEVVDCPQNGVFQLLAAAIECDVQVLLPALFYVCALDPLAFILGASRQLREEDIRRLLVGRDKLLKFSYEFGAKALFAQDKCASESSACLVARVTLLTKWMEFDSFDHPSFNLEELKDGLSKVGDEEIHKKVCGSCKEKSSKAVKEVREDLWDNLPLAFDLGDWEKVKGSGD